jgi:hypothetical protein
MYSSDTEDHPKSLCPSFMGISSLSLFSAAALSLISLFSYLLDTISYHNICSQKPTQHYLKMNFTNRSNVNKISTPLLGNCLQHESHGEQGNIPCPSLTPVIIYDDEEESCQKAAEDESQWTNNRGVVSVVLPALVFLQFGMAFSMMPVEANTGLQWFVVNFSIVMFVIAAALYRQTLQDSQLTYLVPLLLPEILMDTVMGLVLCGQVVPAFLVLMGSMLCMTAFVSVRCIYYLVFINSEASPEKDCDEESLHDEFGVGFEPLWTV